MPRVIYRWLYGALCIRTCGDGASPSIVLFVSGLSKSPQRAYALAGDPRAPYAGEWYCGATNFPGQGALALSSRLRKRLRETGPLLPVIRNATGICGLRTFAVRAGVWREKLRDAFSGNVLSWFFNRDLMRRFEVELNNSENRFWDLFLLFFNQYCWGGLRLRWKSLRL